MIKRCGAATMQPLKSAASFSGVNERASVCAADDRRALGDKSGRPAPQACPPQACPPPPPIKTQNKQIWEQKELRLPGIGGKSQREPLGQSGLRKRSVFFQHQRTASCPIARGRLASLARSTTRGPAPLLLQTSDNLDFSLHQKRVDQQTSLVRQGGGA